MKSAGNTFEAERKMENEKRGVHVPISYDRQRLFISSILDTVINSIRGLESRGPVLL